MHHADPAKSLRLAKALNYLKLCGRLGCTTAELQANTGSMAPGTDCSELRHAGYPVSYAVYERKTRTGRKVYRYRYEKARP